MIFAGFCYEAKLKIQNIAKVNLLCNQQKRLNPFFKKKLVLYGKYPNKAELNMDKVSGHTLIITGALGARARCPHF